MSDDNIPQPSKGKSGKVNPKDSNFLKEPGDDDEPDDATVRFNVKGITKLLSMKTEKSRKPLSKKQDGQPAKSAKKIAPKVQPEEQKQPDWWSEDKYVYTDKCVQDLVKQIELPGVSGPMGKYGGELQKVCRPEHQLLVQFKPNDELLKEALKMNEHLSKQVAKMEEKEGTT